MKSKKNNTCSKMFDRYFLYVVILLCLPTKVYSLSNKSSPAISTFGIDKAYRYFKIKLWRVPFQAHIKAMKKCINKNTIMIVGSAPGFPHGIIDPIELLIHI